MIKDSPCYKCTNRKVTANYNCHVDCEEYLMYKSKLNDLPKKDREDVYAAYINKAIYRRKKIKNEKNRT